MAVLSFSRQQISKLLSKCDNGSKEDYLAVLEEFGFLEQDIQQYDTEMGRLMLVAETVDGNTGEAFVEYNFFEKCTLLKDMRCQVGQVKSNLESRLAVENRTAGQAQKHKKLSDGYEAFMRNVNATVLLFDKSTLKIGDPGPNGKIRIDSVECWELLDLSEFDGEDKPLCDSYFYANEQVPDTDILGSGFFIAPDSVVTAAHVLEKAFFYNISPPNLMMIRGHFAYNSKAKTIDVEENQLYLMDQTTLIMNDQVRYGDPDGDMALIKVKPYGTSTKTLGWNGFTPDKVGKDRKVYALGHGLGIPMKLSFNGVVTEGVYNHQPSKFACKMHILPGNSGSPIFDADTHQLVGIVGGLHEIKAVLHPPNDCVDLTINMAGPFNGIATHIEPFTVL